MEEAWPTTPPCCRPPSQLAGSVTSCRTLNGPINSAVLFSPLPDLFFFCLIRHNNHVRERLSHYKKHKIHLQLLSHKGILKSGYYLWGY